MTVIFVYRNYQGVARTMRVTECRDPEPIAQALSELVESEVAWKAV